MAKSGEIDIMEHVGYHQGMMHGTVHTQAFNHMKGTQKGDSIQVSDISDAFHLYAVEWTADRIDFLKMMRSIILLLIQIKILKNGLLIILSTSS